MYKSLFSSRVRVKCIFKPLITQQITKLCYAKLGATIYLSIQLILRINKQYSFVYEAMTTIFLFTKDVAVNPSTINRNQWQRFVIRCHWSN